MEKRRKDESSDSDEVETKEVQNQEIGVDMF